MNQYEIVFITNLPSFYKLNLFNQIAKYNKLLVIFTHDQSEQRNADFFAGDRTFDFKSIAKKSAVSKIAFVHKLISCTQYRQLILGGWDHPLLWYAALISPPKSNAIIVESSIWESEITGIKGWVKKVFLKRVTKAYVSGKSQADLCIALGFHGNMVKTKGVGVFNIKPQLAYLEKSLVKNFIYVGRLSPEKNLAYLIETFNKLSNLRLAIVGFGPQESYLKSIAAENIVFYGAIPNQELYKMYQQNDVFILPSLSEPWGMVVEEALNSGLPVIVSDKVGCAEEIVNETNGIVFKLNEPDGLRKAIAKMQQIEFYNRIRLNISKMNFEEIADKQVKCYLG